MVLAHERGDEGVLGVEGVDHGDLDSHGCEGVTESGDDRCRARARAATLCILLPKKDLRSRYDTCKIY